MLRRPPEHRKAYHLSPNNVDEFVLVAYTLRRVIDCMQLCADDGGALMVPHHNNPTKLQIPQRLDAAALLVAFLLFNNVFPLFSNLQIIPRNLTPGTSAQLPNQPPPRPDPKPYPSSTR